MLALPCQAEADKVQGLDSASAREVVASIRHFAQLEGIIVIATIHAPSIDTLNQFDKLLVLAEGKVTDPWR